MANTTKDADTMTNSLDPDVTAQLLPSSVFKNIGTFWWHFYAQLGLTS